MAVRPTHQILQHMPKQVLQRPNKHYFRPLQHAGMDIKANMKDMAGVGLIITSIK